MSAQPPMTDITAGIRLADARLTSRARDGRQVGFLGQRRWADSPGLGQVVVMDRRQVRFSGQRRIVFGDRRQPGLPRHKNAGQEQSRSAMGRPSMTECWRVRLVAKTIWQTVRVYEP